jgi:hypothetical protein
VDPPVLAVFVRLGFAEAVIEEQDALAVWDRRGGRFGDIESCEKIGDVVSQCLKARKHGADSDEVGRHEAHDRLCRDSWKRHRLARPSSRAGSSTVRPHTWPRAAPVVA